MIDPPVLVQTSYLVLAGILLSLILMQVNQRVGSPILSIAGLWLRWLVFAFGGAQLCTDFKLIDRSFWVLTALFFIIWFLGETLYNWLAITAHSLSPLPLFPRYTINTTGEEWPVQPQLLRI